MAWGATRASFETPRNFTDAKGTQCQRSFACRDNDEAREELQVQLKRWLLAGLTIDRNPDPLGDLSRAEHMQNWPHSLGSGSTADIERFGDLAVEQRGVLTPEQRVELKAILRI